MTNHGTNVGWSCYRGGRVNEDENLGVNFPPKNYPISKGKADPDLDQLIGSAI
jgi:hypothetical protein